MALPAVQKKYFFRAIPPPVGLNGRAFVFKTTFLGSLEKFQVMAFYGLR